MTESEAAGRILERMNRVRNLARERDLAAVVLASPPRRLGSGTQSLGNTAWVLGYTPMGGSVVLVVPVAGDAVVFAGGPNERRMLAARIGALDVRVAGGEALGRAIVAALADRGVAPVAAVGIAGVNDLPRATADAVLAALPSATGIDAEVARLRRVGDGEDVAAHRRAAAISDAMIETVFGLAPRPGVTPALLMAEAERTGRALGADAASLWLAVGPEPPITCFEFFELPEAIRPGDRVQLGTNVSLAGHFGQELRMAVWGPPSPELQAISERLLAIQDAALETLRVGEPVHTLGDTLERLIDETCPFSAETDPFRFQSCHQLGFDYSEPWLAGALDRRRDRSGDASGPVFEEGMVLEIHPNFTMPGLGHVCAGDMALVTRSGGEWITAYPRGLEVLG